jgi:hypothetical protein
MEEEEEEGMIHTKALANQTTSSNQKQESPEVPPIVHEVLNSPGQPLDPETLTFMESRFEHDFSQVQIHTNTQATESARAINARAYTVGQDIVFDAEHYAQGTSQGKLLLAHELTHVVQQTGKESD